MVNVAEAMSIGTRHHQAGQWTEAERLYRQVLAVEPQHPHALHQLGMLALQARRIELAIELFERAIRADRSQAAFHMNLGEAHRHAGRLPEALDCVRRAVKHQPGMVDAHTKLGILLRMQGKLPEAAAALQQALRLKPEDFEARTQLGCVLQDQNKLTEAEACMRRVLRTAAERPEAHFNLGGVLQSQGKLTEAAESYHAALRLMPNFAAAHTNLGTILKEQKRTEEAVSHFEAALAANPRDAAALTNLGAVHESRGQLDEAFALYQRAVDADPRAVVARNGLGVVLQHLGKLDAAVQVFREVQQIDPAFVPGHMNLGNVFQSQGKMASAIACYREVLAIEPNNADAYNNIGSACAEQGLRDESMTYYRRAIELNPGFALAHGNLAVALQMLGRLDESIAAHRAAVELAPDNAGLHSNLLYALNYHPRHDPAMLFAEHRAWGQRHADPLTARSAPHTNARERNKRLRVGYLSPNFMAHAVNFFSEPILTWHDHTQFEIVCYADMLQGDETTNRLRTYADEWREIGSLTDEQVCDLVRRDQIDILVDLTGHIGCNRLLIFARKPAPVQVTYIGYQNTTGMRGMDYRPTDEYSDPPGATEAWHTETLVRMPRTFFCYLPSPYAPLVDESPAVKNGFVTFGSFNNFSKITPDVLRVWAQIVSRVAGSRLILLADITPSLRQYVQGVFDTQGVDPGRLELVNRLPREKYLELISRADVALDPFPFNGHTTTCDALWQGVPVVTLSGQNYVSRFGGSGLMTLGLESLIARTAPEYIEIATTLASDVGRLKSLRGSLRQRMAASPLLDFQTFTRNLEAEYRKMWIRWCADHSSPVSTNS